MRRTRMLSTAIGITALLGAVLVPGLPASASTSVPLRPDACERSKPARCLGPFEQRSAYRIDRLIAGGTDGRGTTVVVLDAGDDPYLADDLAAYERHFGLPHADVHVSKPFGTPKYDPAGELAGYAGATSIDVEQVHAIAPAARIEVVLARSGEDADVAKALRWIVRHEVGEVVLMNLGDGERCFPADRRSEHRSIAAGSAKGMTFVSGTGISGPVTTCDGTTYTRDGDYPTSDPNVLAVGATRLTYDGEAGVGVSERVFNERRTPKAFGLGWQASGSGYSSVYAQPAYQRTVQHSGKRATPDVAISGSDVIGTAFVATAFTGKGVVSHIGGGIMAGSQWAGIVALAVQQHGGGLGAVNPRLYRLASDPDTYRRLFNDVQTGDNGLTPPGTRTFFRGSSAGPGWDPVSGFGTPKADALVPALAGA
jgi:subtilase family serine protease